MRRHQIFTAARGAPTAPIPVQGGADREFDSEATLQAEWTIAAAGVLLSAAAPAVAFRPSPGGSDHAVVVGAMPATFVTAGSSNPGTAADSSAIALNVPAADTAYFDATGKTLDGAGLKIGIISNSFNDQGGMSADITAGLLPPASQIDIVQDGTGDDEGRAMAQLVYQIAPGAEIYFYSGEGSTDASFADAVSTLAADGCNVIVDDLIDTEEPFYQDTGVITEAVENAIAGGVSYFTAAGNNSDDFYESTFEPLANASLPGIPNALMVHNAGSTSPYVPVFFYSNPNIDFTLEWTQPFGGSSYDIGVGLYSYSTSDGYSLVYNFSTTDLGGDPVLSAHGTLSPLTVGIYYLAFYESGSDLVGGQPITPGTFKLIFFQDTNGGFYGADGEGVGSGTSIGHELAPGVNTVAAVNVQDTPAEGQTVPSTESFSSAGPGETYINAAGQTLATPIDDEKPDFAATDGTQTSVFNSFLGTSAATPNAGAVGLLMLQADSRLAPAQVTYLLERSAISTGDSITGGAGLIQADTAVEGAMAAASTPAWTAQGGSTLWSNGQNWSDGAVPGAASPVAISDGLGLFMGAYAVAFDQGADTVASLTVDGGTITGAEPTFRVDAGDALTTGAVTLGAGTVEVAGTLADTGALLAGSAVGAITVDSGGHLSIGGASAEEGLVYSGVGGQVVLGTSNTATLLSGLELSIGNFAAGDGLDLSGLKLTEVAGVHVDGSAVTVVDASDQTLAALQVSGAFTGLTYGPDSGTGTEILACFCDGTRIATEFGDVPVERLRPGQLLRTAGGKLMPLRWLGRSRVAGRRLDSLPVRIRAGALGHGLPVRDLLVSPGHALFLDGLLVQAGALVNFSSIACEQAMPDSFSYWHVELDTHALVLAEGVPAESFLDGTEPTAFENYSSRIAPIDARELPYPRCKSARQVPRALAARLGARHQEPPVTHPSTLRQSAA